MNTHLQFVLNVHIIVAEVELEFLTPGKILKLRPNEKK